jgi:(1->4)-alpha-D-glucan 1-alpha-D-glucosylmutase
LRRALQAEVVRLTAEQMVERFEEGLPKLWLTRQALRVRRERPDLFGPEGTYSPVWASGTHNHRVLAFERGGQCLVVAPLRILRTAGRWEDTALELPVGKWRNILTGDELAGGDKHPIAELLRRFPVALLVRGS